MYVMAGILTVIPTYSKAEVIHGKPQEHIAHSPSFYAARLLLLVMSTVYPCASHLATQLNWSKAHANSYLTWMFVQNGVPMDSDRFTKALQRFTDLHLGYSLGLRSHRQFMSAVLTRLCPRSFGVDDETDYEIKEIKRQFDHSEHTADLHYGISNEDTIPEMPIWKIESHQRVCMGYHAFLKQLHPDVLKKDYDSEVNISILNRHQRN